MLDDIAVASSGVAAIGLETGERKIPDRKKVSLALQGGGAHGAFTWGVLDTLLSDERIEIEAVSATSAGGMNAVVMAYGLACGGSPCAREMLGNFWRKVSAMSAAFAPAPQAFWPGMPEWMTSAMMLAVHATTSTFSPYQLNPLNINPLRDLLGQLVDFQQLRASTDAPRVFLSATNVRTGKIKIFRNDSLSAEAVIASACLPHLFQAVEIDGEHYWDGGYMGNPAIFPLIYEGHSRDIVLVHINPIERTAVPTQPLDILNRMNEISFNSSLMREMRAIAFVTQLIDDGVLDQTKYRRMLIHAIRDDATMGSLGAATKLHPEWKFICRLRDQGQAAARDWLDHNYERLGKESTIDVAETYL